MFLLAYLAWWLPQVLEPLPNQWLGIQLEVARKAAANIWFANVWATILEVNELTGRQTYSISLNRVYWKIEQNVSRFCNGCCRWTDLKTKVHRTCKLCSPNKIRISMLYKRKPMEHQEHLQVVQNCLRICNASAPDIIYAFFFFFLFSKLLDLKFNYCWVIG